MKTYQAEFDPKNSKGVFGISLVLNPAMEGQFISLKKQKLQFATVNEEQRIVVGLVLEPNKLIPRIDGNGDPFNITFDAPTVKSLCYAFTKNKFNSNSTIEHETPIEGVSFVENWIVRDPKIDTAVALGLEVKKDQWISVSKIDNDEVWQDYVKTGVVKGFSVDAMLNLKEINLKKDETMSNKILDAIKELKVQLLSKEPVMGTLTSGEITIQFEGEMLQTKGKVWKLSEDGTQEPLEVGSYELDDKDQVLVVAEAGVAEEVKAKEVIEDDTDVNVEFAAVVKDLFVDLKKDIQAEVKKGNDAIEVRFAALEKQNKDLKVELERLSEQPAARKIIATPSNIELDSKGKILTKLRQA